MANVYGNGTSTATVDTSTYGSTRGNTVTHFYDRAGIKAANRVNLYGQFSDRKSMPKKMGKTFKISKFLHLYDRTLHAAEFAAKGYLSARSVLDMSTKLAAGGVVSLGEGVGAVNKVTLHKVTMEASLARYGEMIDYTDEVDLFSEDAMQVRYREELGELANSRYEDLVQLDMLATPTVMIGGTGVLNQNAVVSYDLIRGAVKKLVRNRAKKTTSVVSGDVRIDTRTVAKAYYAIIGAEVKSDLENLTRGASYAQEYVYIPVHKYASAANLAEGEVGAMHEVRFIESEAALVYRGTGEISNTTTNPGGLLSATNFATNALAIATRGTGAVAGTYFDAFPILFPTEGAFATVGLKGQGKIKFNAKSPEKVENANPYGMNGFFSYNFFYAGIILQEEKLLKVMVTASA